MTVRLAAIREFRGAYLFLSNFYPWDGRREMCEPVWMEFDGIKYPSAEHAYQAQKYGLGADGEIGQALKERIARMTEYSGGKNPAARAKKAGRDAMLPWERGVWDEQKDDIMYRVVLAKFTQSWSLRRLLMNTSNAHLEEGNWWGDRYWGVSPAGSGRGLNRLGEILMRVREELR